MSDSLSQTRLAEHARSLFVDGPWLMQRMQWYRPFICPFGQLMEEIPLGSTVLDVACGGGLFLGLLHCEGRLREGVGFDASRPAIAVAQQMAQRVNNREGRSALRFEHRDVQEAWPEGTFDVVSLIDVMHHVPMEARRDLLCALNAKTRPGGRIVYKDINCRSWIRTWANTVHDLVLARQWVRYSPIDWVEGVMRDQGLRVVRAQSIDMLCYGHDVRVFEKPAH